MFLSLKLLGDQQALAWKSILSRSDNECKCQQKRLLRSCTDIMNKCLTEYLKQECPDKSTPQSKEKEGTQDDSDSELKEIDLIDLFDLTVNENEQEEDPKQYTSIQRELLLYLISNQINKVEYKRL